MLFNLGIETIIRSRKLTAPPMTISAEIDFARKGKGQSLQLTIMNASSETKAACEQNGKDRAPVIFNAGWNGDRGTAFVGEIIATEIETGIDEALRLTATDATAKFLLLPVAVSYSSSVLASEVIRDIAKRSGISAVIVDLERDYLFFNFSVSTTLGKILAQLQQVTKTPYYFSQGQLTFRKKTAGVGTAVKLDYSSGLLNAQKIAKDRVKVKSIYQNRIFAGAYVQLDSADVQGNYIVDQGKHSVSSHSESITEFEAVVI